MKKKMCFVVSAPSTAVSFLKDHIERLAELFDIYLVANITNENEIQQLKLAGFKNIQIERKPNLKYDLRALWQLYTYFRREGFFIVQSQASKPSLLMAVAAFFAGVPYRIRIFTGQIWCDMIGFKRYFYKSLDKLTVLLNTHLLADGFPQMDYLVEQKIVKAHNIRVLGNGSICGVDLAKFKPNTEQRYEVRSELNYTADNIVYVFLGRLKADKGIRELFSAFNNLVLNAPEARLLLLGKDEENCEHWLADYPTISDGTKVHFYGFTSMPYKLLKAGDVYVLPSYREGFGMSVLEASCLELPVICSDIYGMADTFVDGVTGLKCKVKDDKSLFEAMKQLYENNDQRREMGRAGRRRVEEKFSKKLVTDAWVEYYKTFELNQRK